MKLLHIRLVSFARNSRMISSPGRFNPSLLLLHDYYVHISFLFRSLPVWKNIVPRLEYRLNNAITTIDTIFFSNSFVFFFFPLISFCPGILLFLPSAFILVTHLFSLPRLIDFKSVLFRWL